MMRAFVVFLLALIPLVSYSGSLIISTPEQAYEMGSTIKVTLKNEGPLPIYLNLKGWCIPTFNVQKLVGEKWKWIDFYPTKYILCNPELSPGDYLKLDPLIIEYVQIVINTNGSSIPKITTGNYRVYYRYHVGEIGNKPQISYSKSFKIK